jgi:hypothetical protein
MLTNMGYKAAGFVSGKEALDAMREHNFEQIGRCRTGAA